MGESTPDLFRLEVPCNRDAPYLARDAVDRCEQIRAVREDARLIASELVTNAVVHSGCERDHTLEVRARLGHDHIVISVTDPCLLGQAPRIRVEEDPTRGGFGLRVVAQIARRWGCERPNGLCVWAELALAP